MSRQGEEGSEALLRRIEERLGDLERLADPVVRESARELFDALLNLHGVALAHIVAKLARLPGGASALDALGRDHAVRPALLLYGLHPQDRETRVRDAVSELQSEGIGVALVGLDQRGATVTLPAAAEADLEFRIESALYAAAPELEGVTLRHDPAGEQRLHAAAE